ncbi:MAG TPA: iron-sulfur cluster repair di-iron protein [Polyangiaceae bacterium]|nr:iron-sulfur cluster repair di-iron protein [Polyangiaceae bacterium]
MIQPNETLGHVAATHPAATQVFLRHHLDFCCGGGRKLGEACREAGLDPYAVIGEIVVASTQREPVRWDTRPLRDLIEFILIHYHEPLRRDLRALTEAARKVERVHGKKPSCPLGLAALLEQLEIELHEHMDKEEQVLFPAIQSGVGARLQMPVRVMMQEHDDHGVSLRRVRERAADFQAPAEACATWRALYSGLAKLEAELMQHIHLENNVLFPRALEG